MLVLLLIVYLCFHRTPQLGRGPKESYPPDSFNVSDPVPRQPKPLSPTSPSFQKAKLADQGASPRINHDDEGTAVIIGRGACDVTSAMLLKDCLFSSVVQFFKIYRWVSRLGVVGNYKGFTARLLQWNSPPFLFKNSPLLWTSTLLYTRATQLFQARVQLQK